MSSTALVSGPRIKKAAPQTASIQSLDRGLFILEAVAKSADPVALGQLTDLLGIDRSSVFRLANTLRRRGFLANPDGRKDYVLGPSIWRLSRKHDWSNVLITFSHEHLRRLAVRTGETTHLRCGRAGRPSSSIITIPPGRSLRSPARRASSCRYTVRLTARPCSRTAN